MGQLLRPQSAAAEGGASARHKARRSALPRRPLLPCCPPPPPPLLQLVDHPFIRPASIHSHEVLEGYAGEYLYLGAVRFVKQARPLRSVFGPGSVAAAGGTCAFDAARFV